MPTYEVEINGEQYEVEAPDEQALSIAINQIQGMGGQTPTDSQSSSSGGWDGAVRSVARGALGIGSYLDEIDAATNATLAPIIDPLLSDSFEKLPGETWGERYDQALDIQRRKDREYDAENPYKSMGYKIAGGIGSGGALLKAAPAIGNFVLGNGGATLPTRIGATLGSGGATGFVQGFGAGQGGPLERLKQAGVEAATGAGTGLALMPVAAGATAGINKIARLLLGESDDALSSMGSAGREYVTRELADPDKVQMYRQSLDALGPDAMLADVSPDWLGVARGSATRPGTRGTIIDPLAERAKGANNRLLGEMETSLGPDPIPSRISSGIDENLDRVGRFYRPLFENRSSYDFAPIAKELDKSIASYRGDAQKALRDVRGMLNEYGKDAVTTDPAIAFETRNAIDGLIKTETNSKAIGALTEARQMIDDALTRAVPGLKEVDAQFAELSRQQEALSAGRKILNNEASAMRPVELEQSLTEGALPQGMQIGASGVPTRMRQSTLGELYRAVGTQANNITALRKIVRGEGDWNRDKLAMLFGQDNADSILNSIDRERAFETTANKVMHGSDTAMSNRFGDFLDDITKAQEIPADTTLLGGGLRMARGLAKSVLNQNATTNANQVAQDIGRLSVMRGPERDLLVEALMRRGKENVVDQQRQKIIDLLIQGSGRSGYQSLPGVRN